MARRARRFLSTEQCFLADCLAAMVLGVSGYGDGTGDGYGTGSGNGDGNGSGTGYGDGYGK